MIANGYAGLADLKARLQLDDDEDDRLLERVIESASRAIDKMCRRRFYRYPMVGYFGAEAPPRSSHLSERRLPGVDFLSVRDLVVVESLQTDEDRDRVFETTWDPGRDYWLSPPNAAAEFKPYSYVEIDPHNGRYRFPPGRRSVLISGTWGYAFDFAGSGVYTAPPDVQEACLLLATRYLKRKDSPLGVVETSGLDLVREEVRVHSDPDVKALLRPYRLVIRP